MTQIQALKSAGYAENIEDQALGGYRARPMLERLLRHQVVGGRLEGFCIETLIDAAPTCTQPFFYRTDAEAEIDLVLRLPGDDIRAIEIKLTTTRKVSLGFHLPVDTNKAGRKILVYAGKHEVPTDRRRSACNAFGLGRGPVVESVGLDVRPKFATKLRPFRLAKEPPSPRRLDVLASPYRL